MTPPYDDRQASEPSLGPSHADLARHLDASFAPPDGASLSRAPSAMNLTSSTLMGIFSQAACTRDHSLLDRDEPDTPWGMGARTPVKRPGVDDTYELMRGRAHLGRRSSSYGPVETPRAPWIAPIALWRAFRAGLLFLLGVGYGVLVTRLRNEQQHVAGLGEGIIKPGADRAYLAFWDAAGVVLGSLLPWVDRRWDEAFGSEADAAAGAQDEAARSTQRPGTDCALVVRAIGAFVGIIFAIVRASPRSDWRLWRLTDRRSANWHGPRRCRSRPRSPS